MHRLITQVLRVASSSTAVVDEDPMLRIEDEVDALLLYFCKYK